MVDRPRPRILLSLPHAACPVGAAVLIVALAPCFEPTCSSSECGPGGWELVSVSGTSIEFEDSVGRRSALFAHRRAANRIRPLLPGSRTRVPPAARSPRTRGQRSRLAGLDDTRRRSTEPQVYFYARGIRWGPKRSDGPAGESGSPRNANRPIPNRAGAALIGKVGASGGAFYIGGTARRSACAMAPVVPRHQRRLPAGQHRCLSRDDLLLDGRSRGHCATRSARKRGWSDRPRSRHAALGPEGIVGVGDGVLRGAGPGAAVEGCREQGRVPCPGPGPGLAAVIDRRHPRRRESEKNTPRPWRRPGLRPGAPP